MLLRQIDHQLGLTRAVSNLIEDPREPTHITHEQRTLICQRVYGIAAGYEDGDDHHQLRLDPMFQLAADQDVDQEQPLGSPSTLSRLENRVTPAESFGIHEIFLDNFFASFKSPPKELILDFDATDDRVHGEQEGKHYSKHYKAHCYLPLYVFCGEQLLVAYLRSCNRDGARHSRGILKLLVDAIRERWPDVRIVFRGDGGFCRWKLHRWCDRHGVFYITGLPTNSRLKKIAQPWVDDAERLYVKTNQKQRLFNAFDYAAGTWDRKRRVVAKAEHHEGGANLRFVVTNLPEEQWTPQQLYDDWYCQRGEMENRIKEQQLGLFADRTSCSTMKANQFRVLLSGIAYVLMERLRAEVLVGTKLAQGAVQHDPGEADRGSRRGWRSLCVGW